jgi:hypothetical protein
MKILKVIAEAVLMIIGGAAMCAMLIRAMFMIMAIVEAAQ